MNATFNKILILRLSAIGDTIHTLPLASVLKKNFPDCKIGWVVEDKAQLFVNGNPLVDKCYVLPKQQWKKRGFNFANFKEFKSIIDEINSDGYDLVIDTQQLLKTALILPFLKIKRKIALTGGRELSSFFVNEIVKAAHDLFDPSYHVVDRTLELASYLGCDVNHFEMVIKDSTDVVKSNVSSLLSTIDSTKKTVVFSPATTWVNKHWDEQCWIDATLYLKDRVNLIFTGTNADISLIERITTQSNAVNANVLAGKTNLLELAEVFRRSDIVVSPDSGSLHIAWAVNKPDVVAIFTSTAEKRTGPFGEKCHVLASDLDCHPCLKKTCKRLYDKDACRKSISSESLIQLLNGILHLN